MKSLLVGLVVVVTMLQYHLWFADNGILNARHLKQDIAEQQIRTQRLARDNEILADEINCLRKSSVAIENRARSDLGMVKKGEIFYQIIH